MGAETLRLLATLTKTTEIVRSSKKKSVFLRLLQTLPKFFKKVDSFLAYKPVIIRKNAGFHGVRQHPTAEVCL